MKRGRPKKVIESNVFSDILLDIAENSMSLRSCLIKYKISRKHWLEKVNGDEQFKTQYEHAREERADNIFEDIMTISDHSEEDHTPFTGANVVNRDRLRIDARKWMLSKMLPKKYGEKIEDRSEADNEIIVRRVDGAATDR